MKKNKKDAESFAFQDFKKSGISEKTIKKYFDEFFLEETDDGWKLFYTDFPKEYKIYYYTKRLKEPDEKGKYRMPTGQTARLFRPIDLPTDVVEDPKQYLILTEGAKKAIKAVQEGFPCISLNGVWNWKQNPEKAEPTGEKGELFDDESIFYDIIPDIVKANWAGKPIYLCYDSDMWRNPKVKSALYQFAAYLISEKKAIVKIILLPDGEAKGLDDFLIAYGNEAFQKLLDEAKALTLKDIQDALSDKENLTEFPLEVFPDDIAELINGMHQKYDAAVEYIASVFLSVIGILICGHCYIIAKPSSNWVEHPILWVALIGSPSQKKTPCLKIGKDILDKFDEILKVQYESDYQNYKQQLDLYEWDKNKRKNTRKNKKGKVDDNKGNEDNNADEPVKEPEKPYLTRFTTQNVTIESLFDIIRANQSYSMGVAIYLDELAFLLNGFNQYKRGGNDKQYFLQSWSRTRQNIVRKNNKIDYTVDVGHNIIGGIQPKVLNKTLLKEGIDSTDGMIERWLYCCSDYLEQGFSDNEPPEKVSLEGKNCFEELCQKIFVFVLEDSDKLHEFHFTEDAQEVFIQFCNKIIKSKKSSQISDLAKSYLQKQTNYLARLSLILQMFYNYKKTEITADILEKAIKICKYFISCFFHVINEKVDSNSNEDALISYLITKKIKTISPTQLYKSNENRYKTPEKARNLLEHISKKGYGRLIKAKNGVKFVFYGS